MVQKISGFFHHQRQFVERQHLIAYVSSKSTLVNSKLQISPDIFLFSFCLPLFILASYKLADFVKCKLDKKWEIFDIIQIFFGMSNFEPVGSLRKFMYIFIIIVSAVYNNDFYSSFLEISLISDEVPLSSFKDLNESGFKFYTQKWQFEQAFWSSDEYVQSLKKKATIISEIVPCLQNLTFKNDPIKCIIGEKIDDGIGKLQSLKFLKAKPLFNCLRLSYYFEKSSPYAWKFQKIFGRVYESGIERILLSREKDHEYEVAKSYQEKKFLVTLLISILSVSYLVAFIVFLFEIKIHKKFNVKLIKTSKQGFISIKIYRNIIYGIRKITKN